MHTQTLPHLLMSIYLKLVVDRVQTTCPVVEYKVTAVNCGVCPSATHNTSITCVVDDVTTVIDNLCILSIQSVVCGVTGENRSNATASLRGIIFVLALLIVHSFHITPNFNI